SSLPPRSQRATDFLARGRSSRRCFSLFAPTSSSLNRHLTPYSDSDISESEYETGDQAISPALSRVAPHSVGARRRGSARVRHHAGDRAAVRGTIQNRTRHAV